MWTKVRDYAAGLIEGNPVIALYTILGLAGFGLVAVIL
jgi:hypothetical protein